MNENETANPVTSEATDNRTICFTPTANEVEGEKALEKMREAMADPEIEIESLVNSICPMDQAKARMLIEAARKPKKRRKRLPPEDGEVWIPLRKIFGTTKVPEAVADVITEAIESMKSKGDIGDSNKWQALEFWSAEYLAENGAVVDDEEIFASERTIE